MQTNITAATHTLKDTMEYEHETVLTYKIEYPQFSSTQHSNAVERMNQYYSRRAKAFEKYIRRVLYFQAVEQYRYAKQNGYPVLAYEAEQVYEIPYMTNRWVSLYSDQYTYTGGAHGTTVRSSQTWNPANGRLVPLKAFFPPHFDYTAYIADTIVKEIEYQNSVSEDSVYFEDYEQNVRETFNPESFYLTAQGIIVYFQQYDIAPYSSGLPEFLIKRWR